MSGLRLDWRMAELVLWRLASSEHPAAREAYREVVMAMGAGDVRRQQVTVRAGPRAHGALLAALPEWAGASAQVVG